MTMKHILLLGLAGFSLTACASSPTQGSWACHPRGDSMPCSDIEQIDNSMGEHSNAAPDKKAPIAFGALPARWWTKPDWPTTTRQGDPIRQNDRTMRVVVAPYVDSQGDFHGRSEVFAVVEKADWWTVPPVASSSQPSDGQNLEVKDTSVLPSTEPTVKVSPIKAAAQPSPATTDKPHAAVKSVTSSSRNAKH